MEYSYLNFLRFKNILLFLRNYDKIDIQYILSSSVVEQSAVNRLAVGSSPTWGVLIRSKLYETYYRYLNDW